MRTLLRLHDGLTGVGFWGAALAVAYLTLVTAWEVFGRYALNAPSDWAPDTAAVSFAMITFLAVPMVTRNAQHARMGFIVDGLDPAKAVWANRATLLVGIGCCGLCAWYAGVETLRQVQQGVTIISVTEIPKWIVTGTIAYGLTSTTLYFLRHFAATFRSAPESSPEPAESGDV